MLSWMESEKLASEQFSKSMIQFNPRLVETSDVLEESEQICN
jgi:hypothetical protein